MIMIIIIIMATQYRPKKPLLFNIYALITCNNQLVEQLID